MQVKRLHAYKRQLLNVLHILYLYNRLKEDASFILSAYFYFWRKHHLAIITRKIIKLINELARKVNNDPYVSQYMKVIFLENYRVSLAEDAADGNKFQRRVASGVMNL